MAKQTINTGAAIDDPSAESILSAFTKVNAMTLELFTAFSLGGLVAIDLDASPDTIRGAFVKTNTNLSALYTNQSLPGLPVIDVGDAPNDPSAETIFAAFTTINAAMGVLYAAVEPPVPTADYYVATTGNNTNPGTLAAPFRTIAKGASLLSAGKTLLVRGGTYAESLLNNIPGGTSWAAKVRIAAYPGETVWLAPTSGQFVVNLSQSSRQYIELDGLNMDAIGVQYAVVKIEGWSGGNAHHIRIMNAELKGSNSAPANSGLTGQQSLIYCTAQSAGIVGGNEFINLVCHRGNSRGGNSAAGIYLNSSNNLIDGCEFYDLSLEAIQVYNGYSQPAVNNIIRNNRIHDVVRSADTRLWGMILGNGSTDTKVYNNLVYHNGAAGLAGSAIHVFNASNTEVYNNTVYGNIGITKGIYIETAGAGTTVKNNISYANAGANYTNNGSGTVASNNLFGTNPLVVNAGAADFHLQSSSPARSAGVTQAMATSDLDGVSRGSAGGTSDAGAYEYVP